MGRIPILGQKQPGVADLRPEGVREPQSTAEWINHPNNVGMKVFVLELREALRDRQRRDDLRNLDVDDVLDAYLAGFLSGMTLIQGVFLGAEAFIMARDARVSLPEEYERAKPPPGMEEPEEKEQEKAEEQQCSCPHED